MCHASGHDDVPTGMKALAYAKSNKRFPTYALMQKIWNKLRQLQGVEGFTKYSPIWANRYYEELMWLDCGARWRRYGVTHVRHIFTVGKLIPFHELREKFHILQSMLFYYLQLQHVVKAQAGGARGLFHRHRSFHIWLMYYSFGALSREFILRFSTFT